MKHREEVVQNSPLQATAAEVASDEVASTIHAAVRESYGRIARSIAVSGSAASPTSTAVGCCGSKEVAAEPLKTAGCCASDEGCGCESKLYDPTELNGIPQSAKSLSLGSGNPLETAALRLGETVIDLGSGGGIDVLRASILVGPEGRVIGIDMTPEMLERARAAAAEMGATNVDFREGRIEALPVDDGTADVVISNCVINLAPDKERVFREMYRALAPGGRIAISDIVRAGDIDPVEGPGALELESWAGCVAGAIGEETYRRGLAAAGFVDVLVSPRSSEDQALALAEPGTPYSARITARKSAGTVAEY